MTDRTELVQAYLSRGLEYRLEAERLRRRLALLEARATRVTPILSGVPHGAGDRDGLLASLADLSRDYGRMLVEAERRELELNRFLDALPTMESRLILKLYYLDRLSWPKVLERLRVAGLDVSERKLYRLRERALAEAARAYSEGRGRGWE
ncbi:MAG: DUF1492 domain-containing protein [Oscillospiraceae bacterium]|nr:DUF1492 domain-containing protein [Oscillospiraceae bacterium]